MPTDLPPWVVMWLLATALYAVCKWLTWSDTRALPAPAGRRLVYLFAWPGMDAKAFLDPRPLPLERRPRPGEWAFAASKCALGFALIGGAVPLVPVSWSLLRGWTGMAGLTFVLHFGSFHVLSCVWRSRGVDARPLMNWPVLSTSPADFWGRRWNTAFRDLTHRFLFRPLSARLGTRAGLMAGFFASGLVHELVITVPAGGGYGGPTLYFLFQGLGLLAVRSRRGRRLGLGDGGAGRLFTAFVVVAPAALLFPPPFMLGVILPFLAALGVG